MLTATTQGSAPTKQIAITAGSAAQVMYTVPAGRTFTGHFFTNGTSPAITINGVTLYFNGYEHKSIVLAAGTVVACGANANLNLIGVEQ